MLNSDPLLSYAVYKVGPMRSDAAISHTCINYAHGFVVRLLEDRDQPVNEDEKTVLGRRLVSGGVNQRPQSVSASLRCRRRLQLGTNHAEERVDGRLCRPSLVDEHVTQQSKCALVDLTT